MRSQVKFVKADKKIDVMIDGKLFIFGGKDENEDDLASVDVYDIARNVWTRGEGLDHADGVEEISSAVALSTENESTMAATTSISSASTRPSAQASATSNFKSFFFVSSAIFSTPFIMTKGNPGNEPRTI